jgi:fructose-bisphosphate aldolase/2-amino-3,7-dideoxy-D-threo-hept-6-ulosonate synthase
MSTDMDVLNMVADSIEAGGRGVSMGRNVFQNKNVEELSDSIPMQVRVSYDKSRGSRIEIRRD